MNNKLMACIAISLFAFANLSAAQTGMDMQVDEEQLAEIFGDKIYSPYAGRTFPA